MTPELTAVDEAISLLLARVSLVGVERVAIADCGGRVLAEPIATDRPSPPLDASAMDGFAVRTGELAAGPLPIGGECRIGQPPRELPPGVALRIFTGSPVPIGADAVVRVEDAVVDRDAMSLRAGVGVALGDHVRRRGENAPAGAAVLGAGQALSPAAVAALASLRTGGVRVHRRVRVAVIVTGDELVAANADTGADESAVEIDPWRLRDSNGPTLAALVRALPYATLAQLRHAGDSAAETRAALEGALTGDDSADLVVLTGGVSKGDYDCVPDVVRELGGEVLFHGLALRPGKPAFGAVLAGVPVLALPGNPVSVMVTGRTLLGPVLRKRAGHADPEPKPRLVTLDPPHDKPLALEWRRPAVLGAEGRARIAPVRGSGDVVGGATSDGFVVIPANTTGAGPFPFYRWTL
ncbi:MAG: molybdopterin molybdotransferase MoeA [Lacipirellulaceae bacterium]